MSSSKTIASVPDTSSNSTIRHKLEVDKELAESALAQFIVNISTSRISHLTKNLNFDVIPIHEPIQSQIGNLTTSHMMVWGPWGSLRLSISCSEASALRMYSRLNPEPIHVQYDHRIATTFISEYQLYIGEFMQTFFKERKIPSGLSSTYSQKDSKEATDAQSKRKFNPDIKLWKFTCQESPDISFLCSADILITDPLPILGVAVDFRTAVATEVILNEICEIEYFQ